MERPRARHRPWQQAAGAAGGRTLVLALLDAVLVEVALGVLVLEDDYFRAVELAPADREAGLVGQAGLPTARLQHPGELEPEGGGGCGRQAVGEGPGEAGLLGRRGRAGTQGGQGCCVGPTSGGGQEDFDGPRARDPGTGGQTPDQRPRSTAARRRPALPSPTTARDAMERRRAGGFMLREGARGWCLRRAGDACPEGTVCRAPTLSGSRPARERDGRGHDSVRAPGEQRWQRKEGERRRTVLQCLREGRLRAFEERGVSAWARARSQDAEQQRHAPARNACGPRTRQRGRSGG